MCWEFDGKEYERLDNDFYPDDQVNTWNCPECDEVLFTDEDSAREFLLDEEQEMKADLKRKYGDE